MTDNVQVPGYKLLQKIGEGGMATVYLAMQESLDREVALKIMSPVLAANETFREQFLKEGRIAAKLTHPHLMTVHDIGSENGIYYLASEYLPAGTLRDRMQRLNVAEILEVVRDVASGLSYAHEMGFVHRDVKPGNIMFRSNGSAVLADFGIAKAIKSVSAATMAGNAIGTPDYMSPEQAQATPVDGRSDLYSLGAVLFECLSGRKPYQAGDAYAVALMHVTDPVPKLPEKLAWLQPLIDGMMAKQPDQRFATGDEFIAACDRLLTANPQMDAAMREARTARKRASMPSMAAAKVPQASATGNRKVLWMGIAAAAAIVLGCSRTAHRDRLARCRRQRPHHHQPRWRHQRRRRQRRRTIRLRSTQSCRVWTCRHCSRGAMNISPTARRMAVKRWVSRPATTQSTCFVPRSSAIRAMRMRRAACGKSGHSMPMVRRPLTRMACTPALTCW